MVMNDRKELDIKELASNWPLTPEAVNDEHLELMLKMTPAQRLAMAEELLDFAIKAGAVKAQKKITF